MSYWGIHSPENERENHPDMMKTIWINQILTLKYNSIIFLIDVVFENKHIDLDMANNITPDNQAKNFD